MSKKIAVIGAGNWGKNHIRSFYEMGNLYAVCDKDPETLQKMKQKYPIEKFTSNSEEIFSDGNIDGVVIAVPAERHYELARKAISAGKHVLIEKPMTTTVKEAEYLVELSKKNPEITVMVGHLMNYHPVIKKVKDLIKKGELGNIEYLYSSRVNLGKIRMVENVIWSLAVHDISVFVDIVDSEVEYVDAQGKAFLQVDKNIEDVAFINLYFKNGTMAHIHASWLDPIRIRKMTFVGDSKMAVFDDTVTDEQLKIYDKGVHKDEKSGSYPLQFRLRHGDILTPFLEKEEPLRSECRHFIECIKEKKKPLTDVKQGLDVIRILAAADKAIEKSAKVDIRS